MIELIIIMVVVGTLLAIGLPSRRKATDQARDAVARANIRDVLYAELVWWSDHDAFTSEHVDLLRIEPGLQLHSNTSRSGSVYIVLGQSSQKPALCLFAEGGQNNWMTLYYSSVSDGAVSLTSPEECTRRMLDEQTGQKPPPAPDWKEPVPTDTMGPTAKLRR
jgi:type II secretory pathway pseudopilin PulG